MKNIISIIEPYRITILLAFVLISVILTSFSLYKKQHQKIINLQSNLQSIQKRNPNFKITLFRVDTFVLPLEDDQKITYIDVSARIKNNGAESIAVNWKITVVISDTTPPEYAEASPTVITKPITIHRPNKEKPDILTKSDFTFENEVANNPLKSENPPIEGRLLFYTKISEKKIWLPNTTIKLTVEDFSGKTFSSDAITIKDAVHLPF